MRKIIFAGVLLLLSLLLLLPAGAVRFETVNDRAGLLEDTTELTDAVPFYTAGNVRYFLLTDKASSSLAEKEVRKRCGISDSDNAVVLAVRLWGGVYYYDMYTYGLANTAFSDKDVDAVLDDTTVSTALKSGNVTEGAARFGELCNAHMETYMAKAAAREARRPLRNILICLVVFLVTGGIAVLSVALYYRKKVHGETYPLDRYAKLNLTYKSDRFVGSFVTRTRIASRSSGGGGGRSMGGGGGHRGGR